ncbi:hypothetical protein [Desulfocicer vacuolatum]|nr:hypothetical protein [Desulfocicer vacuolatum]
MKDSANRGVFQTLLWAEPDQNTVRPWRLYEKVAYKFTSTEPPEG